MSDIRIIVIVITTFFSINALATCPLIIPCKVTAEASTIAGSNAEQELITFTQNITKTSTDVASALSDMSTASINAQSEGAKLLISSMLENSQNSLNTSMTVKKALLDAEMTHEVEMAENEYKQSIAIIAKDDTKEEIDEILAILAKYPNLTVPEVIAITKDAYDNNPETGFVLVPLKSSEGLCDASDVNDKGHCAVAKRAFLGSKLQSFYAQCNAEKIDGINAKKKNQIRQTVVENVNKKTLEAINKGNSAGASSSRLANQKELSCTPLEFKNKECQVDITKEDYQEAIVLGKIIPGGDVSASNFSSPTYTSSDGLIDDLSEEEKNDIRAQALDRTELIDNPTQKVVPFKNTYKNANQVKSAMNFIDNVVSEDLIENLPPRDRRKVANAEYQSRYISAISALSMSRLVLTESMSLRVGEKMRKLINNGTIDDNNQFNITAEDNTNKESITGAGLLDILDYKVVKQSANMQLGDVNGDSGNVSNDFVTNPTQASTLSKILDSLILQNEMLKKEMLMNDQLLSLKAIQNAQEVNSKSSINYMKALRRAR